MLAERDADRVAPITRRRDGAPAGQLEHGSDRQRSGPDPDAAHARGGSGFICSETMARRGDGNDRDVWPDGAHVGRDVRTNRPLNARRPIRAGQAPPGQSRIVAKLPVPARTSRTTRSARPAADPTTRPCRTPAPPTATPASQRIPGRAPLS